LIFNTLIISVILVGIVMLVLRVKLLFKKDAVLEHTPVPLTMAIQARMKLAPNAG